MGSRMCGWVACAVPGVARRQDMRFQRSHVRTGRAKIQLVSSESARAAGLSAARAALHYSRSALQGSLKTERPTCLCQSLAGWAPCLCQSLAGWALERRDRCHRPGC
ncbi:hypothetical protein NDU88_004171 [Pleurodeles waltl]|uniref:Uncharacterized protein n=1 Tax=Pleurodeles waltl TaxID=8319 RepID=A0AAV7MXR4_PLEWA|nr:hypothetical protein NDU88_004171 [Pleurodeles waltl]